MLLCRDAILCAGAGAGAGAGGRGGGGGGGGGGWWCVVCGVWFVVGW